MSSTPSLPSLVSRYDRLPVKLLDKVSLAHGVHGLAPKPKWQIVVVPRCWDCVPVQDNGVHAFYETDSLLVLRNRGSSLWTGMVKDAQAKTTTHRIVTLGEEQRPGIGKVDITGDRDAAMVLAATERAAAEAARTRELAGEGARV